MSSLSHSMVWRTSIAALVTTASSVNGPRVMTKPPTWVERWRGKPTSSSASSQAAARREPGGSSKPRSAATSAKDSLSAPHVAFASPAVMSSESPRARPTSRMALLSR